MKYEEFSQLLEGEAVVRNYLEPKIAALRVEARELEGRLRLWSSAAMDKVTDRERVVGGLSYAAHAKRAAVLGERIFILGAQFGRTSLEAPGMQSADIDIPLPSHHAEGPELRLFFNVLRIHDRVDTPIYSIHASWGDNGGKRPGIKYHVGQAAREEIYNEGAVRYMLNLVAVEESVDFAEGYLAEHGTSNLVKRHTRFFRAD